MDASIFPEMMQKKSFSGCNGCAKNELYSIFAFVIRTCLEVEIEFWKKLKTKIQGCKKKLCLGNSSWCLAQAPPLFFSAKKKDGKMGSLQVEKGREKRNCRGELRQRGEEREEEG